MPTGNQGRAEIVGLYHSRKCANHRSYAIYSYLAVPLLFALMCDLSNCLFSLFTGKFSVLTARPKVGFTQWFFTSSPGTSVIASKGIISSCVQMTLMHQLLSSAWRIVHLGTQKYSMTNGFKKSTVWTPLKHNHYYSVELMVVALLKWMKILENIVFECR